MRSSPLAGESTRERSCISIIRGTSTHALRFERSSQRTGALTFRRARESSQTQSRRRSTSKRSTRLEQCFKRSRWLGTAKQQRRVCSKLNCIESELLVFYLFEQRSGLGRIFPGGSLLQ